MGKFSSLWRHLTNRVYDIESGGSNLSQREEQNKLIEMQEQDLQSCLNLKEDILSIEMEIETLQQEIQVSSGQEKLEKERRQKDLQQRKLRMHEQLQQQIQLAQPQLQIMLDQQQSETSEEQHQRFSYMPDSDSPIPDPSTDPVVDPQSQQEIVFCHTQQLNPMSGSPSNGILYQIKGWMCCCNMVVVKKVVNQGYKWVKGIVSNIVGWISRVVCCCGVVVRGRITNEKVELGTVVTVSIAFLVYENLVYSLVWNVLTKHTQLGDLVQKSWQVHMAVGFGTLISTGLFGVFTAQWTIRWILKLIGQYAEEAAETQGGDVKNDLPDSRNEDPDSRNEDK